MNGTNGSTQHPPSREEYLLKASIDYVQAQRASQANAAPGSTAAQQANGTRFRKAIKYNAKGRVALIGVSGSGKSYTALLLARSLAGPGGKIAAVDTEHGSLSKYADLFEFDVDEPTSYSDDYLLDQLTYAEQNGYAVFLVDSLSHFWMGKDGTLEFVDKVRKLQNDGNGFAGWKAWTPRERSLIDRFLSSPCHIIVTMRVKTEYQEIVDERGKKKRVKVGLQPIQRDGLEYEFDLVCSMDDENNLLIDKTRCMAYSRESARVAQKPDGQYFAPFIEWLAGADRPKPLTIATMPAKPDGPRKPWSTRKGMAQEFKKLEADLSTEIFYKILAMFGVDDPSQFKSAETAWSCYQKIQEAIEAAKNPQTYEHFVATEGDWQ